MAMNVAGPANRREYIEQERFVMLERYKVGKKIGEGSFGSTYLGEHKMLR